MFLSIASKHERINNLSAETDQVYILQCIYTIQCRFCFSIETSLSRLVSLEIQNLHRMVIINHYISVLE